MRRWLEACPMVHVEVIGVDMMAVLRRCTVYSVKMKDLFWEYSGWYLYEYKHQSFTVITYRL